MAAYYNEWDAFCCAWQRELIVDGLIAPGFVDQTDVRLVRGELLRHFNQWHLFSGIAVWSAALRMAGWADDREVLTVSCPCQPFSSAGKRKGTDDERHLWPYAMQIIREIKPAVIFGEQVWSADTVGAVGKRKPQRAGSLSPEAAHRPTWLHDVQAQLEAEGYTFGAVGIPACGFGAPHIRQRLYFCGIRQRRTVDLPTIAAWPTPSRGGGVANGDTARLSALSLDRGNNAEYHAEPCCESQRLDNPAGPRLNGPECQPEGTARDEARLRLPGAGCTTERLGDPCCAASERHAGSLLAPEEGKHGAGVAVDGAVSERLEHASPGMGGLAQPMHTERRSFSEPGQDGRDGQDGGREEAHGELGTCGEVRGLSDTELYGSPRRALPGSSGATVTARQPGRQQAVNDGELARGRVDALAGQSQPGPTNGLWAAADWLYCRDDKWRPSIPSHEPVADDGAAVEAVADLCGAGILAEEGPAQGLVLYHPLAPAGAFKNRVHELKGAGNALCIAQAAEFIAAVMAEIDEGAV